MLMLIYCERKILFVCWKVVQVNRENRASTWMQIRLILRLNLRYAHGAQLLPTINIWWWWWCYLRGAPPIRSDPLRHINNRAPKRQHAWRSEAGARTLPSPIGQSHAMPGSPIPICRCEALSKMSFTFLWWAGLKGMAQCNGAQKMSFTLYCIFWIWKHARHLRLLGLAGK